MKTSKPKVAVCLIVRDAAETIEALLTSIAGAFDEIVIVDTGSMDDTKERVVRMLVGPGAEAAGFEWPKPGAEPWVGYGSTGARRVVLASFEWIDDFAAARNYAFGLATSEWRGYLDADDTFPRAAEVAGNVRRLATADPR